MPTDNPGVKRDAKALKQAARELLAQFRDAITERNPNRLREDRDERRRVERMLTDAD